MVREDGYCLFDFNLIISSSMGCQLDKTGPCIFKLRLGAQSVTLWNTLRDPTQLRRRQCTTRQGQDILFIHDYWLGALINCSIEDNNGQLKKRCFCLVAHWRRLNCVGSLKVFNNVKLWAPNLSFQTSHRGWSTSQKHVWNPLNPSRTFFAG